jgi:2,4-dienoyl-CoA reductase-like NADH-dependent reductase (Old Yellow Enzyme family)
VLLEAYTLRGLTLRNRIVVSPMCQYSCTARDGLATNWHLVHLGSRAVGGAGLVFTEATAVTPEGRISPEDLGLWSEAHADALAPIVHFAHSNGAAVGIQLAHAGRKASTSTTWTGGHAVADADGGWTPFGPTDDPASPNHRAPRAMDPSDIARTVDAFAGAAQRADNIGVDVLEIHAAHGYLLHSFLSPLSNHREDAYGGTFEQRARLLFEVVDALRLSGQSTSRCSFASLRPIGSTAAGVRLRASSWQPISANAEWT